MTDPIQFRSPEKDDGSAGDTIRVALLTGQVVLIGPEWRSIPENMHRAALAAGAVSDKHIPRTAPSAPVLVKSSESENAQLIRKALEKMCAREKEHDFTNSGTPNLRTVSHLAGHNVDREETLRIWNDMLAEQAERDAVEQQRAAVLKDALREAEAA